ncbi:MAG TPA: lysine--tRNA ligase [Fimbriimonadaceae bacterium]|nr:lysine--tRNA ligase [Fimbriimonadaceae bacterium]
MADERSIREVRLEKLQRMRELGCDPFKQERFVRTRSAQQMLDRFEGLEGETVSYAGRVVSYRLMGKAGFAHVSDGDAKIQVYFRKDDLSETEWELYHLLDIGDHVGLSGELFRTKTGEKSIHARSLIVLSKCLEPLPIGKEKDGQIFYGLSDTEQRYRHRHLDLLANPEARAMLINRARITAAVRHYFDSQGYLEVETPMLQVQAGGATARPFTTHYNAYEMDMKLRISLELYLKRIICGDVPKVYEIGRVFRNEGLSNRHNPEFTLIEFYEAYANLEDMMTRMEECFRFVAKEVFGTETVRIGGLEDSRIGEEADSPNPAVLDFSKPWRRVDLLTEIESHTGLTEDELSSLETAIAAARAKDVEAKGKAKGAFIDLKKENNLGGFIEKLLEVFVEPTLQEPTFVIGYPLETSPLAKKDPNRPGFTRRFEGYVLGREICNAFSEINDPIDQRERFEDQLDQMAKGNDEAHGMDEEFLYALECGMPPTGGCGFGIDRMAMLLTGAEHIREIMLFPTMRPEKGPAEE